MTETTAKRIAVEFFDDPGHKETADAYAWNPEEITFILRVGLATVASEGPPRTMDFTEFVGGVAYKLYLDGEVAEEDLALIPAISREVEAECILRAEIHAQSPCMQR